jgi:CRISPR-associated helicase Cas3/CRISPR-associated endonuclease Cas3-HD
MEYYGHSSEDGRYQLLSEHLKNTAKLASEFAAAFGASEAAYQLGLVHDMGKYSKAFQKRIRSSAIKVDHATAGSQYLYESNKGFIGLMGAYCVAGHHGGLPDGGRPSQPQNGGLYGRLRKPVEDFSSFFEDFNGHKGLIPPPEIRISNGFQAAFYVRMLFSCLVDADWLDTDKFMSGMNKPRGEFPDIDCLWNKYEKKLNEYKAPVDEINIRRTEILNNCLDAALSSEKVFTLTAPTGSGKTISSMAFSLKHAVSAKRQKRRIIYIVPYNTIIEQNAKVFEEMLGAENVLQHHSGVAYSSDEIDTDYKKLLATENWDAPVIVTSSVRFFESLYSNRPSECRKLHNIANSVLVFDEAQMIPLPYLIPCVEAIKELTLNYNCTAVLASATQSNMGVYFKNVFLREIVLKPKMMYEYFRRVTYDCTLGKLTNEKLAEKLKCHKQVLCIVNTRKCAQMLTGLIDGAIHLSTTLHRRAVLSQILERLKSGAPCVVISTSLIEAGVDVDFPVVFREKAGLDSIVQSAGRCNREGKHRRENSFLYVFESEDKPHSSIARNVSAYEHTARQYSDISSLDAIKLYFNQLHYIIGQEGLDKNSVVRAFEEGANDAFSLPFESVAKSFHLIDEDTKTVYVLTKAHEIADRLRRGERSRELFRELQKYSISLYKNDYNSLRHQFEHIDEEISVLAVPEFYSDSYGLCLSPQDGSALFT